MDIKLTHSKAPALPLKGKRVLAEVTIIPAVDRLVSDAMAILGSELARLRIKTAGGAPLEEKESRILKDYVDSLCRLSKEAREVSRASDLSNLTNDELLQLAVQLTKDKKA